MLRAVRRVSWIHANSCRISIRIRLPILAKLFVVVTPQINPLNKSLLSEKPLNPNWVTGFTDAEGSFIVTVFKRKDAKNFTVNASFELGLHSKDIATLYSLNKKRVDFDLWVKIVNLIKDKKTFNH